MNTGLFESFSLAALLVAFFVLQLALRKYPSSPLLRGYKKNGYAIITDVKGNGSHFMRHQ